jgi:biopolymer transport protein ExbD
MRLLLWAIVLLMMSCQGGSSKPVLSKADTLKLYDPWPDSTVVTAFELFKNCIALRADACMVIANGIQRQVEAQAPLEKLIEVYADSLKSRKLYILCDNSIAFDKIASTIGHLKANGISNYKVVRMDTVMKLNEPITINPPSISSRQLPANDSNRFVVSILEKGIELKQAGVVKRVTNVNGLDALLQQYPKPSDSTAVVIRGSGNLSAKRVLPVMRLLRKRGFVRISLVTMN